MSRVLPILFNTEMVRAILDGRKTVTRRLCKDVNEYVVPDMSFYDAEKRTYAVYNFADKEHTDQLSIAERTCPICPGDILYVRETWRIFNKEYFFYNQTIEFEYKDGTHSELVHIEDKELFKRLVECVRDERRSGKHCWHPSIHMPKESARIWLKVKDVRVERLHEITAEDALAEGAERYIHLDGSLDESGTLTSFIGIWNSTIRKSDLDRYGWDANPWVWVIEFERCEKPE